MFYFGCPTNIASRLRFKSLLQSYRRFPSLNSSTRSVFVSSRCLRRWAMGIAYVPAFDKGVRLEIVFSYVYYMLGLIACEEGLSDNRRDGCRMRFSDLGIRENRSHF